RRAYLASDRIALTTDADRMFLWTNPRTMASSVNLRELRPQKADQRRVIDLEQKEGTRGPKRTGRGSLSEVNTDQFFSCGKEQRRHNRSDPLRLSTRSGRRATICRSWQRAPRPRRTRRQRLPFAKPTGCRATSGSCSFGAR